MRLDRLKQLPVILLVGSNLLPIVGVLQWDWDVTSILILYWSENLIIGAFTIVKMISKMPVLGVLQSLFFAFHYGAFCAGHGFFLLVLVAHTNVSMGGDWPFLFMFLEMLTNVVRKVLEIAPLEWRLSFLALAASHGVSLVQNYFMRGECNRVSAKDLMTAPYKRITVLHLAIIFGGMGVLALGSPMPLLLILIAGKIVLDLRAHLAEHNQDAWSATIATATPLSPG